MRCSITCVTVSSSVRADAPGYVALIEIAGGAIAGYCAIGSRKIEIAPASMITSAITHAKMGRLMKNFATSQRPGWLGCATAVPALPVPAEPGIAAAEPADPGIAAAEPADPGAPLACVVPAGTGLTVAPGRAFCRPSTITCS